MNFDITVLGSASALPTSSKFPTAQVLRVHERFFLIDCGEGTQMQLRRLKISFAKINSIFISHLHGDHVFGLFGLLSSFHLLGRKNPINLFGPPKLVELMNFYKDFFSPDLPYQIQIHPLNRDGLNLIYNDKVCEIFSFPLKHRISTFGFLFREKKRPPNMRKEKIKEFELGVKDIKSILGGNDFRSSDGKLIQNREFIIDSPAPRSYAFCSDTAFYPKIVEYIKNVDLLYHESTFSNADKELAKKTSHSTTIQAATIANDADVGKLLLGHLSTRYKSQELLLEEAQTIFPQTELAVDGSTYSIPIDR